LDFVHASSRASCSFASSAFFKEQQESAGAWLWLRDYNKENAAETDSGKVPVVFVAGLQIWLAEDGFYFVQNLD